MRRLCCAILLMLTVTTNLPLGAQESPRLDDSEPQTGGGWSAEISLLYGTSRLGKYVSTDPVAMWSRAWYRFGLGSRIMIGTSQFDVHGAPFVRFGAGPLFLDAGWVIELIDRTSAFQIVDNGPFGVLGFQLPMLRVGPGHFAVTVGLDFFLPLWRDEEQPSFTSATLLSPRWNDPVIVDLVSNLTGMTLAHLGLRYTFRL